VKPKRVALYVRVSGGPGQNNEAQKAELMEYAAHRGWEVTKIYSDKISGAAQKRKGLDELTSDARRRRFSIVAVWRFDRFARSVSHLLQALEAFRELGIEFVSLSEQIDTTTAVGKFV
jgi:DNA invertase Pin-like site-specific DNA recombinase